MLGQLDTQVCSGQLGLEFLRQSQESCVPGRHLGHNVDQDYYEILITQNLPQTVWLQVYVNPVDIQATMSTGSTARMSTWGLTSNIPGRHPWG